MTVSDDSTAPALIVNQDGGGPALLVTKPDSAWEHALEVKSYGSAIYAEMTHDFAGVDADLVDLVHRSTGDAIYIVHGGGRPPSYTGVSGGTSAVNVAIPYYLDDSTLARNGTVINDRTGMRGLKIEAQPPNSDVKAIAITHWGGGPAVEIVNQHPGFPAGNGIGLALYHNGSAEGLLLQHGGPGTAPSLRLLTYDSLTRPVLSIEWGSYPYPAYSISADGKVRWGAAQWPQDTVLDRQGAGTLRVAAVSGNSGSLAFGPNGDAAIGRGGADLLQTTNQFQIVRGDNSTAAVSARFWSESKPRLNLMPIGRIEFGDGVNNPDTTLYRMSAGRLSTNGMIVVSGGPKWGIGMIVPGDVQFRMMMVTDGQMWWSPGNADFDTNLYRGGKDLLRTDDALQALSLAVAGDSAGRAGTVTFTSIQNTATARGTGVGTIKFADAIDRDSAGFIKIKIGTADYFIPVFAAAEAPAALPMGAAIVPGAAAPPPDRGPDPVNAGEGPAAPGRR